MKSFIGRHEVRDQHDYTELSLGTDPALWLGVEGESDTERAARLDAARDILADDPGLYARALRAVAPHLPETSEVPVAVLFVAGVAA
ncbi:hypothetical protein [Streptomyces sp. ST2-7A]|uniref:hypothetical protein n=1 Tax=Streptomyces sp. ST2-7A TaxID=2907214 RepID=UPI001F1EEA22|nr:hypothetical protein [Streptomyces sp. ST2-7A]MCE7080446.1 hypothetical protein [Streptomyces sp. ST2-7A]